MKPNVVLYAVPWCSKCHRLRSLLEASGVAYVEVDPERDPVAAQELSTATGGAMDVPAVRVGETYLLDPSEEDLASGLGSPKPEFEDLYDVAIVGGGPAGLTAAIYAARDRLRTVILEKALPGGQAATTDRIENYPGFPDPVGGSDLMQRVHRQAERFGAEVRTFEEVSDLAPRGDLFLLETSSGSVGSRSVILATGSVYRRMGVAGEDKLVGRGVSFCATCDAPFFKGKHVVVVGGGNSALQETVHLAEYASRITLVQLLDHLTGTRVLEERVRGLPTVEILLSHRVTEVLGEESVQGVRVEDLKAGGERRIDCDGVFVFIGLEPNSAFLKGRLRLDDFGFIAAGSDTLQTSMPGVFAAGDVRSGSSKQITSAVGEGTVAAFMVQKWLEERRRCRASQTDPATHREA